MKPIIFNSEMVKAILEGRKTQTRRLRGLEEINKNPDDWQFEWFDFSLEKGWCFTQKSTINKKTLEDKTFNQLSIKCPYGKTGDRLWARERFLLSKGDFAPTLEEELTKKPNVLYYASDNPQYRDKDKWKPSIHMPKWASRITLETTNIRVEQIQEISEENAKSEGIIEYEYLKNRYVFSQLWDSLNKKRGYGWDINPWVWVIEFKYQEYPK